MWKKLFFVASALLVISLVINSDLWSKLEAVKTRPYATSPDTSGTPDTKSKQDIENPTDSPEIAALKSKLTLTEEEKRQILAQFSTMRKEINRRLGMGNDAMTFITPDSPAVAKLVKETAGEFAQESREYWLDVDAMFRWITQNITYAPDTYTPLIPESPSESITWSPEFWRTPEETLKDKVGDCEDLSVLLASMILNYNKAQYSVWVITMGNKNEGHMAVCLPVSGEMLTIMDPTAFYITGPNTIVLSSRDVTTAVNDWLKHWEKKIPGAQIKSVFNNKFRQDFASTKEFISWAKKQIE